MLRVWANIWLAAVVKCAPAPDTEGEDGSLVVLSFLFKSLVFLGGGANLHIFTLSICSSSGISGGEKWIWEELSIWGISWSGQYLVA